MSMPRTSLAEALGGELPEISESATQEGVYEVKRSADQVSDQTEGVKVTKTPDVSNDDGSDRRFPEKTSEPSDPPALDERLRRFGLSNEDIPEDLTGLDPRAIELVERMYEVGDTRIRGFQSGVDHDKGELAMQRVQLQQKANALDKLTEMPEFHKWYSMVQDGSFKEIMEPEDDDTIDPSSLPADPWGKFKALTDKATAKQRQELDNKVQELNTQIRQLDAERQWAQFKAEHPDADTLSPKIAELMDEGYDLNRAYKVARAESFDPEAEREKLLRKELEKQDKKANDTSMVARHSGKGSDRELSPEQLEEMSPTARIHSFLEEASEELGVEL